MASIGGWRIEVIGADAKVDTRGWEVAFEDFTQAMADDLWDYFEQSLSGFKRHRPTITQKGSVKDYDITIGILDSSPDNNIYSYVNWGTSPRVLVAHNPRGMRFRVSYAPATARGTLRGGTWTKTGPWTVRYTIHHPGTQARRFDDFIFMAMQGSVKGEAPKITRSMRGKFWR